MAREIVFDILNPYPTPIEFYKHELDDDVVYVYFSKNGVLYSVNIDEQEGDYTATAAVTIDDKIIVEELELSSVYNSGTNIYGVGIDFSDYDLFAGLMKIEFKITPKATPTTNYVPVAPLILNITPSILDNASATPQSIGTISDLLQLAPDLETIVNNDLGAITKSTFDNLELEVGVLYTIGLAQSFLYTNSPAQSGYVVAVSESYIIIIASLDGVFYVYGAAGARSACDGAIGSHSIQDNAIKSSHIPNYTIAFSQLSQGLQDTINEMGQRITALENTVGTLNDQLEQALNGGGA